MKTKLLVLKKEKDLLKAFSYHLVSLLMMMLVKLEMAVLAQRLNKLLIF